MGLQAKNTAEIKDYNLRLIRDTLMCSDILTKKQISNITGLSLATCTSMLAELIEKGVVTELELAESSGGRPARQFCINPDYAHIICFYADNNGNMPSIRLRVYNFKGEILKEIEEVSNRSIAAGQIRTVLSNTLAEFPKVRLAVLGIPGSLDENGVVEQCDFDSLEGINLKNLIEDEFGIKLIVGNDMCYTASGTYINSKRKKPFIMTQAYKPNGGAFGAGVVVNGDVLEGPSRFNYQVENARVLADYFGESAGVHPNTKLRNFILISTVFLGVDVVYIRGTATENINLDLLKREVSQIVIGKSIPDIEVIVDIHEDYMTGLFDAARKSLKF